MYLERDLRKIHDIVEEAKDNQEVYQMKKFGKKIAAAGLALEFLNLTKYFCVLVKAPFSCPATRAGFAARKLPLSQARFPFWKAPS